MIASINTIAQVHSAYFNIKFNSNYSKFNQIRKSAFENKTT